MGYSLSVLVRNEQEMRELAGRIGINFEPGDVVLLSGELGAGKTTFVRGYLESIGYSGPVRSPTFNLIQIFNTSPRVMHADLYRVPSAQGVGLEDYLDSHVCFIEWPDRGRDLLSTLSCWTINIEFAPEGRVVTVTPPMITNPTP